MKITIEIPEEFEIDYKTDKFKDFFQRVLADMDSICGNYERETAEMLIKAFESSNPVKVNHYKGELMQKEYIEKQKVEKLLDREIIYQDVMNDRYDMLEKVRELPTVTE